MARRLKPRVLTRCVANAYAAPNERIVEFSFPDGTGGLISFRTTSAGHNIVDIHHTDAAVTVLGTQNLTAKEPA